MKILSSSIVALACVALPSFLQPLGSAAASGPVLAQAPQDRDQEFRTKFRQALEINAKEEIAKLMRAYTNEAINYVVDLCNLIANGGAERVEREMAALRAAWKTAYKSDFIEHMYNYFSLLDPRAVKELEKLSKTYDDAWKKWTENRTPKDPGVFDFLASEYEGLGKAYAELGYELYAARSFSMAGKCTDTEDRGPDADLNRTADNYGACVRACQAFEINDPWAMSVKARFESLTREGKGSAAGSVPGATPPAAAPEPVKSAAPIVAAMHFEAVPNIDAYERPNYCLDEFHILWPQVYMKEKGSSGGFQALEDKKVKILRTGSAALMLDADGDGKGESMVPASGNKALLQFSIGEGAEKRDWAVVTEVGTDKEYYQGLQVNYQANDQQFQLYVMNAASMVGMLNNVPVRVFDDSMDGIYGSAAKQWAYAGLPEGSLQSDIDSVVIGTSKHARPWSEYTEVGGDWYQFQPQKAGVEIQAVPTTLETGKVKLDYKGEMPEYVILQGEGPYENTYIDLLQNGGAEVDLPAGKYHLFFGIVRKGKKQQAMKALMLPGKRTPPWSVEVGKTTKIQLGGPFGFEFDHALKDGMLTVKGTSVTLIGVGFERYERLWNCVPRPDLVWRKAGSKRASKPERFGIIEDLNATDDQGKRHDPGETFHPMDLSVETKLKPEEAVEVQLIEKKNKLFGPIDSAWHK